MNKKISLLLIGVLLASSTVNVFGAEGMIIDGKTYVPVALFEELCFNVSYDSAAASAVISNDKYKIEIPKNKDYFIVKN